MIDANAEKRSVSKWGDAGRSFQLLPDILFKRQTALGLSATDMLVILNITMHWWYSDQRPFPRTSTIAKRMGVEPRTVQRSLKKLSDLKLVTREKETAEDGSERIVCDLSGLVDRLEQFSATDPDYKVRAKIDAQEMVA